MPFLSNPEAHRGRDLPLAAARTTGDGSSVGNRILGSLPQAELHILRPLFTAVQYPLHARLHEPGERLEFAYFPSRGLVSLIVEMRDGKTVEVGVVGCEGLIGTAAVVGLARSPHRAVMHSSGDGYRIRIDALRAVLPTVPYFHFRVSRHAVAQGIQTAQLAACNRLHGAEQRLARWLLAAQDRAEDEALRTTHDFLATRLGTDPSPTKGSY